MTVITNKCPDFVDVDINKEAIDLWNQEDLNMLRIYEPGLDDLISKSIEAMYEFIS